MPAKYNSKHMISISNQEARRFILSHQFLFPPKNLKGKRGIKKIIKHLGNIQYDTINVVGRNADLVLQSRISDYKASLLEEMLYKDRTLIDGWDKMASIYATSDWPYFDRQRKYMASYHIERSQAAKDISPKMLKTVSEQGPLSSIDIKDDRRVDWFWSETRLVRAGLELLYVQGKLGVHHKVNTRRVWDVIERLLPEDLLKISDPNKSLETYQDWHVLRRIGSMGLASPRTGEYWYGIRGMKSKERNKTIKKLVGEGLVLQVEVKGLEGQSFYMRKSDLKILKDAQKAPTPPKKITLIAPLDNLIWNRKLIKDLFDFEYVWEVYKPKKIRQYGYYVLPMLYGDKFIGRIDLRFQRKSSTLLLNNIWWQEGVKITNPITKNLKVCLMKFGGYLGAADFSISPNTSIPDLVKSLDFHK